jgi:hypothetical protein
VTHTQLPTDYQSFIHRSRYARFLDAEGRREHWNETVGRYFDFFEGHLDKWHNYKVSPLLRSELEDAVLTLQVMPSMRALMTAGPALERENLAGFNCAYCPIDRLRAFAEILYILMCGVGVGFSVERQTIKQLPTLPLDFVHVDKTIVVADSKEGWAAAFEQLLYHLIAGEIPKINTENVRPAGARIMIFGGRASGPEPLRAMFEFVIRIFVNARGRKLTSFECHEIVTKIGEIVVVGGVRRAALISLSNLSDQRMRDAKSGNWWVDKPHLALANNSVAYTEKPEVGVFMEEWLSLYRSKSGERGIFNREGVIQKILKGGRRDHRFDFGLNPCVTGDTLMLTSDGYVPIKDTIGRPTEIWNGYTWSEVVPFSTGVNPLLRISFSDGSSIRCTPKHKFIMCNYTRVKAEDLVVGHTLKYFNMPKGIKNSYLDNPITVTSVEDLDISEETFCVTEPMNHSVTFNGIVTGNCGEIVLRPRGLCNLSEAVIREDDTPASLYEKVQLASIIGTWQSTLTRFNFVEPEWEKNAVEERLLGVSLTGIYDNALMRGDKGHTVLGTVLHGLKSAVIKANREESDQIGITSSVATTTIKPSGTVSQLVNCPSGIHQGHSPWYIRRVTCDNKDPLCRFMIAQGVPHEPHATKPDMMTVFAFPVHLSPATVTRNDVTAEQHLELVKTYGNHWSEHAVSCTISVHEHEWPTVGGWVYNHFDDVVGLSFLPHFEDDSSYMQMPYETVSQERYLELLEAMPAKIDWNGLAEFEAGIDTVTATREFACVGNVCEIIDAQKPTDA